MSAPDINAMTQKNCIQQIRDNGAEEQAVDALPPFWEFSTFEIIDLNLT